MMKLPVAFTIALASAALLADVSDATAQDYPYCYQHGSINGGGSLECSFLNMRQCLEAASGRGGTCMQNPAWTPPPAEPKRATTKR